MSIKIYTAYRLRSGADLWPVVERVRRRAERNVAALLRPLYVTLTRGEVVEGIPRLSPGVDFLAASHAVRDAFHAQLGNPRRNAWDLEVKITVRRAGRRWLLVPYPGDGLFRGVLHFMERDPDLEDFHFQTAHDRSDEVSAQAWEARSRVWRSLLYERWRDRLVLSVVSPGVDAWSDVCPAAKMMQSKRWRAALDDAHKA